MQIDPGSYRGVPGIYVLHFDKPVRYQRDQGPATYQNAGGYGDQIHYIGQARDVGERVYSHLHGWATGAKKAPEYIRHAGREHVPFHLAFVRRIDDPNRRTVIEHAAQRNPRRWCSTCAGVLTTAEDAAAETETDLLGLDVSDWSSMVARAIFIRQRASGGPDQGSSPPGASRHSSPPA
jgi:hypothetical protein